MWKEGRKYGQTDKINEWINEKKNSRKRETYKHKCNRFRWRGISIKP
jgi:hypothetical protein